MRESRAALDRACGFTVVRAVDDEDDGAEGRKAPTKPAARATIAERRDAAYLSPRLRRLDKSMTSD